MPDEPKQVFLQFLGAETQNTNRRFDLRNYSSQIVIVLCEVAMDRLFLSSTQPILHASQTLLTNGMEQLWMMDRQKRYG